MNSDDNPLLTLARTFGLISLFAIGGANSAIPEMHRVAVDVQHWLSDKQFAGRRLRGLCRLDRMKAPAFPPLVVCRPDPHFSGYNRCIIGPLGRIAAVSQPVRPLELAIAKRPDIAS
jgi:hypothetical protein